MYIIPVILIILILLSITIDNHRLNTFRTKIKPDTGLISKMSDTDGSEYIFITTVTERKNEHVTITFTDGSVRHTDITTLFNEGWKIIIH